MAGEAAQQLRTFADLAEDPGPEPMWQLTATDNSCSRGSDAFFFIQKAYKWYTYICTGKNSYTGKKERKEREKKKKGEAAMQC